MGNHYRVGSCMDNRNHIKGNPVSNAAHYLKVGEPIPILVIGGPRDGQIVTELRSEGYDFHHLEINHMAGGFEVPLWIHEGLTVPDAIARLMKFYKPET